MANIIFFQIGTTDLTPYVDIQNFDVNSEDIYESWTDGNFIEHREITRSRVIGKIKLGFSDTTDFTNFQTLLSNNRNVNGYYPIQIHVNNTNSTESINAFISPEGSAKWDQKNGRQWLVLALEIRER